MAEKKLSKTARSSLGDKTTVYAKPCPACNAPMVATKVMKSEGKPGGMFWICPKDDQRIRI